MSRRHQGADQPRQVAAFSRAGRSLTTNVRRRRASLGITQAELAERAGVSLQLVNRLESPIVLPNVTLRLLVALACALGCEPHELIVPAPRPNRRRPGRPGPR